MEQNIFDAIMWWVVGFAMSVVFAFILFGFFKGFFREKQALKTSKHHHYNR